MPIQPAEVIIQPRKRLDREGNYWAITLACGHVLYRSTIIGASAQHFECGYCEGLPFE